MSLEYTVYSKVPSEAPWYCNGVLQQLQEPGRLQHCIKFRKMTFSPFRAQSTTPSSMVVVSQFSGFIYGRYSTLQHLATVCNICNNFEILHTGVSRPPELISDEGTTLFLVVSKIWAFKLLCSWGFLAMCFTGTRIERIYFVRLACACQHIVFTA